MANQANVTPTAELHSNYPFLTDVFLVIRGVGERTESSVITMAQELVTSDNIAVIKETPFNAALKQSFKKAIERDLPWTCCIDADILFIPDALLHFRRTLQIASRQVFGMQGFILDKLFGGVRPAGAHMYRTSLLSQALTYIPDVQQSKRPETFVRQAMKRGGHEHISHGVLMGLHGFEQYYRDIYRTAFFHAQKHRQYVPILLPYWERMSVRDPDFLVAMRGAHDGLKEEKVLGLDVRNFSEATARVLAEMGLEEKQPFHQSTADLIQFIERTVARWEVPEEYDVFWRRMREPSRVAKLLGPSLLGRLGLSGLPEQ